ncbi:MAG TPA: hypothetical protein VFV67_20320 [Actinophytocola sp.]|uniref:hypothetical protein n=1 Tax=Actinophytocola sp. TaxID=1872138 RepID=UPI002DB5F6C8|nr:hypothetical protein [Actinophytocola sp.]HEU5472998.1 hypothetical protein [Actinophytocola sp.]
MAEKEERLIAEALRAQAASTPEPSPPAEPSLAGYGLYSGTDLPRTAPVEPASPTRRLPPPDRGVPVLAILILAAALGLAAGAVVGLLTLL